LFEGINFDPAWVAPLIALFSAIGGAWWVHRATGAKEVTEATKILLEPLTKRISTVETELDATRKRLREAYGKLEKTEGELEQVRTELELVKLERAKDRRRLTIIEKWAKALRQQVLDLGGSPVNIEDLET
jgi:chromosome segregation ATPase